MTRSLHRLLFPRSIAFIGGKECDVAIRKTRQLGFDGKMFAVNPRRASVGDVSTVPNVGDLPEAPDAAFIGVPREPTIEVIAALRRIGAGGAVVYASGFSESGDTHLQAALVEAADGMPFLGPNCNGYVNFMSRAVLWPDDHGGGACERGVAIAAQSGNITVNLTMLRRALPVAGVFALGNQADVDVAEMVEAFVEDDRITAIGLHIEGLRDVTAFVGAAEAARRRRKPIVALKTGRSPQGARITMSHTSSLSGEDSLYDALFERLGIARVGSITALAETLKFLHYGGPTAGSKLVSMSCSGGEAALAADMAEDRGVSFPAFDAATKDRVAATLNDLVSISNPLDYQTFSWGDRQKLGATFAAALSGGFDVGMLILDVPTLPGTDASSWVTTADAFMDGVLRTGARAAVVASLPECVPDALAARLGAAGIAPMAGLDDAFAAFEAAAAIGRSWAENRFPPVIYDPPPLCKAIRQLTEHEAKHRLGAAGLTIPVSVICAPMDTPAAASTLGFPVVLKTSRADLAHKTEAGGVALDLHTEDQVLAAATRMATLSDEVLVERMITGVACELIVGIKTDPQFGLALVIGAGGVLAELLEDAVTLLLPIGRPEIATGLARLKVSRLIDGYRGRSGDREAVIAAIVSIVAFAEAHAGRLVDFEVNPLLVLGPGEGAVVADALIRMSEA